MPSNGISIAASDNIPRHLKSSSFKQAKLGDELVRKYLSDVLREIKGGNISEISWVLVDRGFVDNKDK